MARAQEILRQNERSQVWFPNGQSPVTQYPAKAVHAPALVCGCNNTDVVVAGERPVAERCDEFGPIVQPSIPGNYRARRRAVRLDLLPRFRRGMEGTVQHINAVFVESCFSAGAKGPQKPAHLVKKVASL